jgi:ribosomal protein S18 acetylase RimI-like enzyme
MLSFSAASPVATATLPTVTFRTATAADVSSIQNLAERIWWAHYREMLTSEQIDYMLRLIYAPERLEAEILQGQTMQLALRDDVPVGYCQYGARQRGEEAEWFVQKLYLLPELHGQGIGRRLIAMAVADAPAGLPIRLHVHRGNAAAINAYFAYGFTIESTQLTDIGNGYVMDDFVMRYRPMTVPSTATTSRS